MPASGEHKTVQARILRYAQEIGWRETKKFGKEATTYYEVPGRVKFEKERLAPLKNFETKL